MSDTAPNKTTKRPSSSRTKRKRKYRFVLLDNRTGETIFEFNSRPSALSESCQWMRNNYHANPDVSLVFYDASTNEAHFTAAGSDLLDLCTDELVEIQEELGYDED